MRAVPGRHSHYEAVCSAGQPRPGVRIKDQSRGVHPSGNGTEARAKGDAHDQRT